MDSKARIGLNKISPDAERFGLGDQIMIAGSDFGKRWYLDPTNGSDSNDGMTPDKAFKTLEVGYAALTANKNEVLCLIGGSSSISVTTAFTWAKAYTHLIGISAGGTFGRSRIGHTFVAAIESLFTISVAGCIFKNIHWQQGNGNADQLNCVVLGASAHYNTFINCHFDAPLNAVEGALAYTALYLTANSQSNKFWHCTFGNWSSSNTSTDGCLVRVLGKCAGTEFEDCTFIITTNQSTFVSVIAAVALGGGDTGSYIKFTNCEFFATETGVAVIATAPTEGKLIFSGCKAVGVTNWSANSNNVLNSSGPACIADGGLGVVIS